MKWYHLAAEQGFASAQHNLGVMYEQGQGVGPDYKEAVKWYRRAAEQGVAAAQHNFGLIYVHGQGVAQDDLRAYMWFNLAARDGDENAVSSRNRMEGVLTPTQLIQAQSLAQRCLDSNY